jgi:quercetin dioxygenase-like cupin family protein
MNPVARRLEEVRAALAEACRRAGRDPGEVRLVAVSKTVDLERIRAAIDAGQDLFGENYLQEARDKIAVLGAQVSWHLVGSLQSNKARGAVELFDLIHAVDRGKLARALDMKMGYLLVQGEAKPYAVVRKRDRKAISRYGSQKTARYGYAYESLAPEKQDRNMEPFIVTLEPRTEVEPPSTHDGEEFIYVLEGAIEVQMAEKRERLEPEDSIYYDSTQPHLVRCAGDRPARILAVLYTQGKK